MAGPSKERPATTVVERVLLVGVASGIVVMLLLGFVSIFAMTLSADEAWLLAGIQGLAEEGSYAHRHGPGAITTGGLYTAAHWVIFELAGPSLAAHRLFSFGCFVLLLAAILAWARSAGHSSSAALLMTSVVIAVPGTAILAGVALGAVPATLLLVWGIWLWDPIREGRARHAFAVGLILALAAATRPQLALVLPAMLVAVPREGRTSLRALLRFALPVSIAAVGFAAAVALLLSFTPRPEGGAGLAATSSGVRFDASLAFTLKKWISANSALSLPGVVAVLVAADWLGARWLVERHRLMALAAFAALGWLAWILAAPVAHFRYLWPILVGAACVAGFGLAALYDHGRARDLVRIRIAALLLGLACVSSACILGTRNVLVGDHNVVTWEWREKIGLQPQLRGWGFPPAAGQASMARYLRELPAERRIGVLDSPLELEYLAQRPLLPLYWFVRRDRWRGQTPPGSVLVTPHLGQRIHLGPEGRAWLAEHCDVEVRYGDHTLCRFARFPEDLSTLVPHEGIRP